jgi:membrane fusion protein (multidrug efflux system)
VAADAAATQVSVAEARLREAQAAVPGLEAARDQARRDLDATVIRAPFDGVVGNLSVARGDYVTPGKRLLAVVPLDRIYVDANFKETQLARLTVGAPVKLEVDAYPGREIVGRVESFSPASGSIFSLLPPENATGNFTKVVQRVPVRVSVPAEAAREGWLRPGMSVVATVDTRGDAKAE